MLSILSFITPKNVSDAAGNPQNQTNLHFLNPEDDNYSSIKASLESNHLKEPLNSSLSTSDFDFHNFNTDIIMSEIQAFSRENPEEHNRASENASSDLINQLDRKLADFNTKKPLDEKNHPGLRSGDLSSMQSIEPLHTPSFQAITSETDFFSTGPNLTPESPSSMLTPEEFTQAESNFKSQISESISFQAVESIATEVYVDISSTEIPSSDDLIFQEAKIEPSDFSNEKNQTQKIFEEEPDETIDTSLYKSHLSTTKRPKSNELFKQNPHYHRHSGQLHLEPQSKHKRRHQENEHSYGIPQARLNTTSFLSQPIVEEEPPLKIEPERVNHSLSHKQIATIAQSNEISTEPPSPSPNPDTPTTDFGYDRDIPDPDIDVGYNEGANIPLKAVKCHGPGQILIDGQCQCQQGYFGRADVTGCYRCPKCPENAECVAPGMCKCRTGYRGDGTHYCDPILPELLQMYPVKGSANGGTIINISYTYLGDGGSPFCRFGYILVEARKVKPGMLSCVSPAKLPGSVPVSISFDNEHWSKSNFHFQFVQKKSIRMLIPVMAIGLLLGYSFASCLIMKMKRKRETGDEILPLLRSSDGKKSRMAGIYPTKKNWLD